MKPKPSIPSDLELLTTAHLNDVPRLASVASRADLIAAIRWCDSGRLPEQAKRREALATALQKLTS